MRFKEFLTEDLKFDLEEFKSDCAYTLGLLRGTKGNRLLYRGSPSLPNDWKLEHWRARTVSRDSPDIMHDSMNKYFTEKLGAPIRNWMFCTGSAADAGIYSSGNHNAYSVIFPVGKFEWVSSSEDDASDMTGFFDRCMSGIRNNPPTMRLLYDDKQKLAIDMMKHKMEKWDWHHNTDLLECIRSKNEIMFKCDKFYSLRHGGATWNSTEFQDFIRTL